MELDTGTLSRLTGHTWRASGNNRYGPGRHEYMCGTDPPFGLEYFARLILAPRSNDLFGLGGLGSGEPEALISIRSAGTTGWAKQDYLPRLPSGQHATAGNGAERAEAVWQVCMGGYNGWQITAAAVIESMPPVAMRALFPGATYLTTEPPPGFKLERPFNEGWSVSRGGSPVAPSTERSLTGDFVQGLRRWDGGREQVIAACWRMYRDRMDPPGYVWLREGVRSRGRTHGPTHGRTLTRSAPGGSMTARTRTISNAPSHGWSRTRKRARMGHTAQSRPREFARANPRVRGRDLGRAR